MTSWVWRRSLGAAATFVVATMVVFTIVFALPGDPARAVAGRRSSQATVDAIRKRYQLDETLPQQYLHWMRGLLRGDLGHSYASRRPVSDILLEALPTTITLVAITLLIEIILIIAIGTVAAMRRGGAFDLASLATCTLFLAAPTFLVGVIAQDLLGVRWALLPVSGTDDGVRSYLLPAFTLALPGLAVGTRVVRQQVLTGAASPHVAAAAAKGLGTGAVTRRHVLRNGLGPFVAFIGLEIGVLMGGSVVVERVFNLPGVGRAIARAIGQRDNSLIIGFTLVLVAVYLLVDLIVDLVVAALDPRIEFDQ